MPSRTRRSVLWPDLRWGPQETWVVRIRGSHGLRPDRAWLPRCEQTAPAGIIGPGIPQPELVRGYAPGVFDAQHAGHTSGFSPRFGKGVAFIAPGQADLGINVGDETDLLPTAAAITIIVAKCRTSPWSGQVGGCFGVLDNGANFTVRCGALLPFSDGIAYFDYGGVTAGTSRVSAAGLTFGDDIWAFTVGARGMEIWQNNVKVASNAGGVSRTDSGGNFYIFSGNNTAAAAVPDNCVIPLLYVYNRQLKENEIINICLDPYQVFEPIRLRRTPIGT